MPPERNTFEDHPEGFSLEWPIKCCPRFLFYLKLGTSVVIFTDSVGLELAVML